MFAIGKEHSDKKGKWAFAMPHIFVILFCVMLFVTALTYVVPSGEFDRVEDPSGRTLVVPGSYKPVENSPVGPFEFGLIIPKGINETISIVMVVLFCCGSICVISATGAIDAGIASVIKRSKSKEHYVLLILFTLFALLGAAGYAEDVLPFVPLACSVVLALGYDKLVAAAVVFCGVTAGFTPGFCNLMTVGVGHAILGLPIFSGMSYRLFATACFYIAGIFYVLRYANKVKKNPELSLVSGGEEEAADHKEKEFPPMTTARGIILILTFLAYAVNVYGAFNWGWYLDEMSAIFIFLAVIGGLIGGLTPNTIAKKMSQGIAEIAPTAVAIGIARCSAVVLREGNILDTIINFFAGLLAGHGAMFVVIGLVLVTTVLNFFVTSGSGKAAALMPLLGPLGQIVGVRQQIVVFAFQMGDGITNTLYPTSAFLMGGLSMLDVPFDVWLKFCWKLYAFWTVLGCVLAVVAQMINLGPF